MEKKREPGRPKSENPLGQRCFRVLDDEWELIVQAAEIEEMTTSAWLRRVATRLAKRRINRHLRQNEKR